MQGTVPGLQLAVAGALLGGCGIASTTLWYYSRRYVGELAVRRDRPGRVTVSVLDFWGNREVICAMKHPLAAAALDVPA